MNLDLELQWVADDRPLRLQPQPGQIALEGNPLQNELDIISRFSQELHEGVPVEGDWVLAYRLEIIRVLNTGMK